jgi:hypothetical protein
MLKQYKQKQYLASLDYLKNCHARQIQANHAAQNSAQAVFQLAIILSCANVHELLPFLTWFITAAGFSLPLNYPFVGHFCLHFVTFTVY